MKNKIGKTGKFPEGKLCAYDEGGLKISIFNHDKKVMIDFGTNLKWLGMTYDEAIIISDAIRKRAEELLN